MHRVFQFIDENLDADLSLQKVAEVAFFSPFHFHRVFKFITGENVNEYIKRQKIEKSALDILHKTDAIKEIAYRYGYSNNASFSKAFKKYFKTSPTEFKKQHKNKIGKIEQLKSKNGQVASHYEKYICVIENLKKWISMNAKIEVKQMSEMQLACVSFIGAQNITSAYNTIINWAAPNGLMNQDTKMVTIYHDSFKVTEPHKVRMNAAIVLNEPIKTEGEIDLMQMDAGKCIVGSFEIQMHEFEKSWTGLFVWMNENGYQKAPENPFAIYYNNYNEHPEQRAIVDLCIPVL